ncbi:hypothetical protein D3C86_1898000 [compost metagenome]
MSFDPGLEKLGFLLVDRTVGSEPGGDSHQCVSRSSINPRFVEETAVLKLLM